MDQIYHPLKGFLDSNRYLHYERVGPQTITHHLDGSKEIGAGTIQFIYKSYLWHTVFIRLMPDRL